MDNFPFRTDFQYAIINLMLKDRSFCEQAAFYLKDDYFDNLYLGWIFATTAKFYKSYEKTPSIETLRNEISKFSASERIPYDSMLENVLACQYDDYDYIKQEIELFVQSKVFLKDQKEIISLFNSGQYNEALDSMKSAVEEINAVSFKEEGCINFDDMDAILNKIRQDTASKVKIGIPIIDRELNGGQPKGTLLVWLGSTNVGKSAILVNHAVNIMKQGKKVVFVDLEMTEDVTLPRFLGCLTGINLNRITKDESFLTEEEKSKIRDAKAFLKEHLKLKIIKDEIRYIENLSIFCKNLKNSFDYEAIVVDYGQKLFSKEKFKDRYDRFGEIYDRLGRIGLVNNAVMITAAQGNRAGRKRTRYANKETDLLRIEDISDSQWIANVAATLLTITKSERDEANDRIKILLDKQRMGRTNIAVEYNTKFDSCQVFSPDMICSQFNPYEEGRDENKD